MAVQWYKTKFLGVRYREHPTRKHGIRPDRCFSIRYKLDGKDKEEAIGWASEGWTAEKAYAQLSRIRENIRTGKGVTSLKALREAQARKPTVPSPSGVTVQNLWEDFFKCKAGNRSIDEDRFIYSKHIKPVFADKKPDDLTVERIDTFRDGLLSSGLAPQTVKNILSLLRRLVRWGERRGRCEVPRSIRNLEMPKVDNIVTENLTSEQIAKLLEVLRGERDQQAANAMRLALCTGMRKTAILSLQWEDLDFEHGFITLRGETAKKGRTEKIPMPEAARNVFTSIIRRGPYVFPSPDGWDKPRRDCRRAFTRIRATAGLPEHFRPMHGLRHTFASLLASSGKVDLLTLQKLLTHGSPQMTQRYAHLHDEALKKASSVIDDLVKE